MEKSILFCVTLLLSLFARSQNTLDLANRPGWQFSPHADPFIGGIKIPFSDIVVEDFRYDTTKLGYISKGGQKRIVCENGIAKELTRLLNARFKDNLDRTAPKTLIFVLRRLWLQQGGADLDNENKIVKKDLYYGRDKSGVNYSDFEIYCKENNKYRALLKVTDEFIGSKYNAKRLDDLLFLSFDSAILKISGINVNEYLKNKKEYSPEFIRDNYLKRFNLPILTAVKLTKGVFMTFDDFKNNKTVDPDFTVKKSKLTDQLYVGEKLLTDFWGFCDGEKLFIRLGFNFFELVRQNNTFDLYGAKYVTNVIGDRQNYWNRNTQVPVATHQATNRYALEYRPLQLDMEEGEVY